MEIFQKLQKVYLVLLKLKEVRLDFSDSFKKSISSNKFIIIDNEINTKLILIDYRNKFYKYIFYSS